MATSGTKICVGIALSLSMLSGGGCAQLQDYGGSLWHSSQSFGNAFVSLLRPAPQQREQFLASVPETVVPKTVEIKTYAENQVFGDGFALQYEHLSVFPLLKNDVFEEDRIEQIVPDRVEFKITENSALDAVPVNSVLEASLPDIKPASKVEVHTKAMKKIETKTKTKTKTKVKPITITLPKMDDIEMLAGEPQSGRKLVFVNKTSRTDIKDLNMCAKQAGTTYVESFMGYDINPEFLSCLNDKGYEAVTNTEA